jgi:hypothetical protein
MGNRAELKVVDRWPAYTVRGEDGTRQVAPARGESLVAIVLVRGTGGWRIGTAELLP